MKHLYLLILFAFLIISGSCDKEEKTTDDQFPGWLQIKITEVTAEPNSCKITDVTIIEYKDKTYYHIYCGLWSCVYCQLFDDKGNRPEWDTNEWNDFLSNKKEIKTLPACP